MTPRNLLVTTDFSSEARKAYGCAADLAKRFGARLHVVHVEDVLPPIFSEATAETYFEELEAAVRKEAKDPAFRDVEVTGHLLRSRRAFEAARDADVDLVLIGTHGVLGSVAQNVIREAPCSVLTIRQEAEGGPRR